MHEIETARLRLRRIRFDDLDDLASICGDPEVMKYLESGKTLSKAELEPHVRSYVQYWEAHGLGRFALMDKHQGGFIGFCGLRLFRYSGLNLFVDVPEIVFLLKRSFWGKGLASEAARACLRYGFEQLNSALIVAMTRSENLSAQRVLERIGMTFKTDIEAVGLNCKLYELPRQDFRQDDFLYVLRDV